MGVFGDLEIQVYKVSHVLDISAFTSSTANLDFTLEIGTIMQYPFAIKPNTSGGFEFTVVGSTAATPPVTFAVTVTNTDNTECADDGTVFYQYWTFTSAVITDNADLTKDGAACSIEASFAMSFKLECVASYAQACPVEPNDAPQTATAVVATS